MFHSLNIYTAFKTSSAKGSSDVTVSGTEHAQRVRSDHAPILTCCDMPWLIGLAQRTNGRQTSFSLQVKLQGCVRVTSPHMVTRFRN